MQSAMAQVVKKKRAFLLISLFIALGSLGYIFSVNQVTNSPNFANKRHLLVQENGLPSSKSGFRPVYIYSNHELADAEVPERSTIRNEFGKVLPYAQTHQDQIILALTKANDEKSSDEVTKQKFFVDLAANDAVYLSNTLYLEQNNWDGVCIEGNPEYWYKLGRFRTCTVIGAFVGGKPEEDGKQVEVAMKGVHGGIVAGDTDNAKENNTVKRELVSIATVFKEANVPKTIDYFNLDVEGAESLVMGDFPWDDYKFRFMTVERPKPDLTELLNANGYVMVRQIVFWGETLWAHEDSISLSQEEMLDIILPYCDDNGKPK